MSIAPILRPRVLVMFAVALILSVSAYGFAAANVVPAQSGLGDGEGVISGYTISSVVYTLDETSSPANITSLSFAIAPTGSAPAATDADVELVNGSSTLFDCSILTGTATCAITGVTVAQADILRVIATSDTAN
jgi:hypothetical protein